MRGRIAVGQGAVGGRRDDLVVKHDDASDRHFGRFLCRFGRFQRQIHDRWCGHASYRRATPSMGGAFSKSEYRFLRENAPPRKRTHDRHFYLHPKRVPSCPATTTKTTTLGAGATVRPAARAAQASLGDLTRSSPSAASPARRKVNGAPMPAT